MRFNAMYLAAGVMLGIGATKSSAAEPLFGLLFVAAGLVMFMAGAFEANNR